MNLFVFWQLILDELTSRSTRFIASLGPFGFHDGVAAFWLFILGIAGLRVDLRLVCHVHLLLHVLNAPLFRISHPEYSKVIIWIILLFKFINYLVCCIKLLHRYIILCFFLLNSPFNLPLHIKPLLSFLQEDKSYHKHYY